MNHESDSLFSRLGRRHELRCALRTDPAGAHW